MRLSRGFKVLMLAAAACLLAGLGGCSPGPTVWRADGDAAPPSPAMSVLREEAAR